MTIKLPRFNRHNQRHFYLISLLVSLVYSSEIHADEKLSVSPSKYVFEEIQADFSEFPVTVPSSYKSHRGYLIVEETRPNGTRLTNKLPVIIVKAQQQSNKPPVLKLSGGPGISGLIDAAYPNAYPWLSDRDFILLGQRGTHDAEPALLCNDYLLALQSDKQSNEELIKAALDCRNKYTKSQVDLNAYHSSASAKDIEGLRLALGITKLSIYAGSYGTRLALTYARDFPDSVSSMVLDSPLPHNVSFDDEYPGNVRSVLQKIADICDSQPQCSSAFPNLFDRFIQTLHDVSDNPWSFKSTAGATVTLSNYQLVGLLNISSSAGVNQAPVIMDAIARKDITVISQLLNIKTRPVKFAWGMRLSVWCSESLPYSRRAVRKDTNAFADIDGAVIAPEICKLWNVQKRPSNEKLATESSVPTLIIAGDFDALTPPKWGALITQSLNNSYLVNVPFGHHSETKNWSGDGCAMSIANNFLKHEIAFLDKPASYTECLKTRKPPEFILSVN